MPINFPTLSDSFDDYSKAKYCTYLFEAQRGGGVDSRQIEVILLFWRKFGLYSIFPLKGLKNY